MIFYRSHIIWMYILRHKMAHYNFMKIFPKIFQILQEERELYGELKTKHNFSTHHNMI
jgi:hypothetical protein